MNPASIPSFLRRVALSAIFLALPAGFATAQTNLLWTGGGGNNSWFTAGNWDAGVPTSSSYVRFVVNSNSTASTANVALDGSAVYHRILTGAGKAVTLTFSDGATLNSTSTSPSLIGSTSTSPDSEGTGNSSLTMQGPASGSASASIGSIYVNYDLADSSHALTLSGNISVSQVGTLDTRVGNRGINNSLTIEDGASMVRHAVRLGTSGTVDENRGNSLVVTGTNSLLTITGTDGTYRGLHIGNVAAGGATYANAPRDNRLLVQDGGRVVVSSTNNTVLIARHAAMSRSNYILVEGTGSRLEMLDGTTLEMGSTGATSRGGNFLEVRNGGEVQGTGTTTINGYYDSGTNDGANKLIIGTNGTYSTSGAISLLGTLQLHDTGVLRGRTPGGASANITMTAGDGGRAEMAGSGLDANVTATFQSGSTLAVGIEGDTSASVFTLNGTANLQNGSRVELTLFSAISADQIDFESGSSFDLGDSVTLAIDLHGYAPVLGDNWTLFTGATASAISGSFASMSMPTLSGSLEWDTSDFNESGAWKISVVPEPSSFLSLLFLVAAGGARALLMRRKKHRTQI